MEYESLEPKSHPLSVADADPQQSTTLMGYRHDGWTGERMATFLETLADTGIVADACDAAAMGVSGAYAHRRRNAAFAAGWDAALTIARDKLADTLLARSIEGNSELILRDGVVVGERQVIDNRLGLAMLRRFDRLAETGLSVSTRGLRDPRAPQPRAKPLDWELALNALRTGEADDLAEALAMLKGHEVEEVEGPPNPVANWMQGGPHPFPCAGPDEQADDDYEDDLSGRCWNDEEDNVWMTDFPPPDGFTGHQSGTFGDSDYKRACSAEEAALLEAGRAADAAAEFAEQVALRDSWFDTLKAELEGDGAAEG